MERALLDFFLPESLFVVGEVLIDRFLDPQAVAVLINGLVSAVFVGVSLLTFPLKEWVSARYERQSAASGDRIPEAPPLWIQGLEEVKLALFYGAMYLAVLRFGLSEDPVVRGVAIAGSHFVLVITVAIDFISPTIARHGLRYADIIRALFARPIRVLLFGMVFAAPAVLAGFLYRWLELSPGVGYAIMASVQLVSIVLAVLAGTTIGGRWLAATESVRPLRLPSRLVGWALVFGILIYNGLFFGATARSAYHVSPILKCDWSVGPEGLSIDTPSLSDPHLGLKIHVAVHNPTRRTAKIGQNRVEIQHHGALLATTAFPEFEVGAGASVTRILAVRVEPKGGLLEAGFRAFNAVREGGVWEALKGAADPDAYGLTLILPTPTGDFSLPLLKRKAE